MADIATDIELSEMLAILAAVGVGGYLLYKYFKSATCITKVGAIPGVTGATSAQANSTQQAGNKLKPGGYILWQCGSCFDYFQPCGVVTEARHNWFDYVPILNNWGSGPVTYKCVPASCYDFCKSGICTAAAARATGN